MVAWHGAHAASSSGVEQQPTQAIDLQARRVVAQGLTRIEASTEGGTLVLGNVSDTVLGAELMSSFRDRDARTTTEVWAEKRWGGGLSRPSAARECAPFGNRFSRSRCLDESWYHQSHAQRHERTSCGGAGFGSFGRVGGQ